MNILGVSAFSHDSAACLLRDGRIVCALQEERFSRVKNDTSFPTVAFSECLAAGGIDILDLDAIAYFEDPREKARRQLAQGVRPSHMPLHVAFDVQRPLRTVRRFTGFEGPIDVHPHHLCHAASAFHLCGHASAAVMVVDAVGEWGTVSFWHGHDGVLDPIAEVRFPQSLGLAYSTVTGFLGFRVNEDEYKVMGLAPYGRPRLLNHFRRLIRGTEGFGLALEQMAFDWTSAETMHRPALAQWLQTAPRHHDEPLGQDHADIAASLQARLEEILVEWAALLAARTGCNALALAGGVAHNSAAIGAIRRSGAFAHLFVQPAAGDAGTAIGAAFLSHLQRTDKPLPAAPLPRATLGCAPEAGDGLAAQLVKLARAGELPPGLAFDHALTEDALLDRVVNDLLAGKVVAWCDGPMEFGPRALGSRSILADPRRTDMRDRVNAGAKNREAFRPFAPVLLAEHASAHVELAEPNPFMTEICWVVGCLPLPAVTHVDHSARPQTLSAIENTRLRRLLERFYTRTGCPVLLNTSLNLNGMPIACTSVDALQCFLSAPIDTLVIGTLLLDAAAVPARWRELAIARTPVTDAAQAPPSAVYTFV